MIGGVIGVHVHENFVCEECGYEFLEVKELNPALCVSMPGKLDKWLFDIMNKFLFGNKLPDIPMDYKKPETTCPKCGGRARRALTT